MILDPPRQLQVEELARRFRERYKLDMRDPGESYRPESLDPEMAKCLMAQRQLFYQNQNRQMTNFMHHYQRAFAEQDPDAIQARKLMFEAERLRTKENEPDQAITAYARAFQIWIKVLSNPQYADFRNDSFILEGTYVSELKYLDLLRQRMGPQLRPALMTADLFRLDRVLSVIAC